MAVDTVVRSGYLLASVHFIGYDVGSSSVKACLFDGDTGKAVVRGSMPETEMRIEAPRVGWAEQDPELWWECVETVTRDVLARSSVDPASVRGIGISYQMHGLVTVDASGRPVRPAIIWCDGRAVSIGERAFSALGRERCLTHLLSSPGNFTASKLRWVREEEPESFARVQKFLLPGDYIGLKMTGEPRTTLSGLSEGILWDFLDSRPANYLLEHYGIPEALMPELVPTFGDQGRLTAWAAERLGLALDTPVTFRAGDQPANALSLSVLEPGDVAANAGTSGVVYGVTDVVKADPLSRINSFAHVNHAPETPRLGVLLCINGTGSAYGWLRRLLEPTSYAALDQAAEKGAVSSMLFYPFGNGAERMLSNRTTGARLEGVDFNLHDRDAVVRAVIEGIAHAFRYGLEIMAETGVRPSVMRTGHQNMMRSRVFRQTLATLGDVPIELYDTDGAEGAARGAAIGAGFYRSFSEAFAGLDRRDVVEPNADSRLEEAYERWSSGLQSILR